jgi:hydrogenase assembly chaperone HypC/HupF
MCLGFPGVVVATDGATAIVETDGRRRRASTLLLPDIRVGDRVVVGAGTILERLDAKTAADIARVLTTAIERTDDTQTLKQRSE